MDTKTPEEKFIDSAIDYLIDKTAKQINDNYFKRFDFPGYENVLIHKGNQPKQTTMKDNLLPFDLEEAKKDPSRIRYDFKEVTDFNVLSTKVIIFIPKGNIHPLSVQLVDEHFIYRYLRLTPKRRFVTIFKDREGNKYFGKITDAPIIQDPGAKHIQIDGLFELIPVKENEAN